jgi:PAS domain S-box-containing protein
MKKPLIRSSPAPQEIKDLPERSLQKNAPAENIIGADDVLMKLNSDSELTLDAEERLTKASRLYQFISSINQMIIRTSDETALFKEACRIAVDIGKFKMTWIGILDPQTRLIKPVIYDGMDLDYLHVIRVIANKNKAEGKGPSGRALEEGKTQFCNNISIDPRMKPWREEALKRGYYSSIAIPIRRFGKVIGVFTLYAGTVNFFDEQEIHLLEEAANDISFAIDFLENELLRKKAQESLLKSERRYQTLTEISPVGIFHTNKDGLVTYVNPQWCQMSGLLKTDASGHGWLNAVHEEDREILAKAWLETLLYKKSAKFEFRFRHKDGRIVWVIVHVTPEKNFENQVIGFVGTITDITERKKNEEELVRMYEENQTVLNRINDGMVSLDKEWRYTFLNDAALATHPKTREEIIGKTIWEVHPELSGTVFEKMYRDAMITQNVIETENYYAPMNIWLSAKAYPSPDGLTIFYKDITERKKAEDAIQNANKQLTLSQKIAKIGYWEMDLLANKNYWTDEMYQLYDLGKPGTVINPEIFFKRIHPGDKELVKTRIKSLIIDGERFEDLEYKFLTKEGTIRYMLSTGESITDNSGRPIRAYGTMQDITERKKVQLDFIKEKQLSDSIIDNLPGIFYIYNKEGKFIQWNKNFESVTQFSANEIRNMCRLDLVPVDQRKEMSQMIYKTFLSGKESLLSNFTTKNGKEIPYYLTGMSIEYQGELCVMVIGIDFSERARIQEEMKQTSSQLQDLTNHLQTIREEERKRIGRELHDELGQQLTAMKMDISWINKQMPAESELIKEKMKEVIGLLDESNTALRRILNELRPTILDQHGLLDALQWQARQFTATTNIPLEIQTSEKEIRVKDEIATCIFRLFQESLTNITRYAEANKVVTFIEIIMGNIIIEIEDDGKGFDTASEQPKSRQPFGILGMKERVRALEGKFELVSVPGKGTKIHISLPLQ